MEHHQLPPWKNNKKLEVMSMREKKAWESYLWTHIVSDNEKYFICKICDERMYKTGQIDIKPHFLNRHGIEPVQMIRDYTLVPTYPTKKLSPAMSEYVSSHFDVDDDEKIWRCKYCCSEMFGRRKDPIRMDGHMRSAHPEVYKHHSSNFVIDDHDRPGCSGTSSNIDSNIMPCDNSSFIKTENESDNEVTILSESEDEEANPNLSNVEVNMTVGNKTIKLPTKSKTCLPDESKQIVAKIKHEKTSDYDHSVDYANELRISAAVGFAPNHQSVQKLSTREYPQSSTNDEQNVKTADSERDERRAESSRSGRVDSSNIGNNYSIASSKRPSSSQPISSKKAKRQSTDTDPVNGRSSQNSSNSLPDSNSTPSDTSSYEWFFRQIQSKFQNLNTESQRDFQITAFKLLHELEEKNTDID